MEVNRLLGDEITYELQIRGLPIMGTVNEKRISLREALRVERLEERAPPITCNLDPGYELTICEGKLADLAESIANFDLHNKHNEFKRIQSRLYHLQYRLRRIGEPSMESIQNGLVALCMDLQEQLKHLVDQPVSEEACQAQGHPSSEVNVQEVSILDTPVPLLPEVLHQTREVNPHRYPVQSNMEAHTLVNRMSNLRVEENRNNRAESSRVATLRERFETTNLPPRQGFSNQVRMDRDYTLANSLPRESLGRQELRNQCLPMTSSGVDYSNRANTSVSFPSHLQTLQSSPIRAQGLPGEYPSVTRVQDDYYRFDVGRLRIQYDGTSSVTTFLERIEELRLSRGIPKDRLLQSAPELFSKEALLWYRMGYFRTWDELVDQLREAFQPHDYEFSLWEEIRKRTQGSQERVINYVAVMENLFKKLSNRPSEDMRIQLIKRNMLPHIQSHLALQKISSLSELIRFAKTIEETEWRIQRFCPPPTTTRHLLEPELAYRRVTQAASRVETLDQAKTSEMLASTEVKSSPMCWNCNESGHRFRKCNKPKRVFCFKCGKDKVTTNSCPNCTKNSKKTGQ